MKFLPGQVYFDEKGHAWTVHYDGISCCKNHVVTFSGHYDGHDWGKTLDALDAYSRLADGRLSLRGQLEFAL